MRRAIVRVEVDVRKLQMISLDFPACVEAVPDGVLPRSQFAARKARRVEDRAHRRVRAPMNLDPKVPPRPRIDGPMLSGRTASAGDGPSPRPANVLARAVAHRARRAQLGPGPCRRLCPLYLRARASLERAAQVTGSLRHVEQTVPQEALHTRRLIRSETEAWRRSFHRTIPSHSSGFTTFSGTLGMSRVSAMTRVPIRLASSVRRSGTGGSVCSRSHWRS
jgi:hypothetical protein